MNLSCNIPSPVPGKYNCEFDFAPFGVVRVVDGMVLGVSDECAAALVALGYYARVESLFEPAAPARSPRRAKVVAEVVTEVVTEVASVVAVELNNPDQV